MAFLVINCGTSTLKMTLFSEDLKPLVEEKTTARDASSIIEIGLKKFEQAGFSTSSLIGIGHRVVHGGMKYIQTTRITPEVERDLNGLSDLAPLHNPPTLKGIEDAKHLFPHVPQIAVFDTAFHAHLPPKAAFYPIPWELSQQYNIRRYGFHGIAHEFSWKKYIQSAQNSTGKERVITVHLGSGCSMAAIHSGRSIDTTMGFTPLDGLMMASRSGELDPSIVAFLCDKERKSPDEIVGLLNTHSGLLGVSGNTAHMEEILLQSGTDPLAKLALEMFIYHIQKQIGAYIVALEGDVDAIIFSGGIGENCPEIRQRIIKSFSWYPLLIDKSKNQSYPPIKPNEIHSIHFQDSKAAVCIVGCDENLFIAEEMSKMLLKF